MLILNRFTILTPIYDIVQWKNTEKACLWSRILSNNVLWMYDGVLIQNSEGKKVYNNWDKIITHFVPFVLL